MDIPDMSESLENLELLHNVVESHSLLFVVPVSPLSNTPTPVARLLRPLEMG